MELTPDLVATLRRALALEEKFDENAFIMGWEWRDVQAYPSTLNKLLINHFLEQRMCSNKHKGFVLSDLGKSVATGEADTLRAINEEKAESITILPEDLFSDIVGYDDEKELVHAALLTEKPVHILLYGPPAIAKTMFLQDIEGVFGEQALWLLGSGTSKAGLWDQLAERRPRIVLIDELEKMEVSDMAGLLSLLEKGRITRTKVGRVMDERLECWCIASANRIGGLPQELLSRFHICKMYEYNSSQYGEVVKNVLVKREGLDDATALQISTALAGKSHDVRDAVRIARLSKVIGVDKAIQLAIAVK